MGLTHSFVVFGCHIPYCMFLSFLAVTPLRAKALHIDTDVMVLSVRLCRASPGPTRAFQAQKSYSDLIMNISFIIQKMLIIISILKSSDY